MSIRTKIMAVAAVLAVTALPGLASAQAPPHNGRADYYAGAPGPNRPHFAAPGDAFGAATTRPPVRVPRGPAPYENESGAYQGSAGAAYQLGVH